MGKCEGSALVSSRWRFLASLYRRRMDLVEVYVEEVSAFLKDHRQSLQLAGVRIQSNWFEVLYQKHASLPATERDVTFQIILPFTPSNKINQELLVILPQPFTTLWNHSH